MDCGCTLENGLATKLYKTKSLLCDHNRLSLVLPGVVKLWSPKNTFQPSEVTSKSSKKVILVCLNVPCDHETTHLVNDLTRKTGVFKCSKCQTATELRPILSCQCKQQGLTFDYHGQAVCSHNNLLSEAPSLIHVWSPNNKFQPDKIPAYFSTKVELVCQYGHLKKESACRLAADKGYRCHPCSIIDNNTAKLHPYLLKEVNDGTDLSKYSYGSRHLVEWKCSKENCDNIWSTKIQTRTLYRAGCPKCAGNARYSYKTFLEKANLVHGNKYSYPPVDSYLEFNVHLTIPILCPVADHGVFNQVARHHIMPRGCPICGTLSKGEELIAEILTQLGIEFERQKRYAGLKNVNSLSYDVYVSVWNVIIEFDGLQHFGSVGWTNDTDTTLIRMKRDLIKDQFAIDNGLSLLRIPYNQLNEIPAYIDALRQHAKPDVPFIATYCHYAGNINLRNHKYIEILAPPIDWSSVK